MATSVKEKIVLSEAQIQNIKVMKKTKSCNNIFNKRFIYFRGYEVRRGSIVQTSITFIKKELICEMTNGDWVYYNDLKEDYKKYGNNNLPKFVNVIKEDKF